MGARERVASRTRSTLDGHPVKLKKEELHRFFLLLDNTKSQATSFVAYDWTRTRLSKILLYDA